MARQKLALAAIVVHGKDLLLLSSSDNMIPDQTLFFGFSAFTLRSHTLEVSIFKAIKQKHRENINLKIIRNKSLISAHFLLHFTTHLIFSFLFIAFLSTLTGAICYTTHHFFIGNRSRVNQSSNLIMLLCETLIHYSVK